MTFDQLVRRCQPPPGASLEAAWQEFSASLSDEGMIWGDFELPLAGCLKLRTRGLNLESRDRLRSALARHFDPTPFWTDPHGYQWHKPRKKRQRSAA